MLSKRWFIALIVLIVVLAIMGVLWWGCGESRKKGDDAGLMKSFVRSIHFIGIGGVGMSGIAEVLNNLGYRISGSDAKSTEITRRLQGAGLQEGFVLGTGGYDHRR